MRAAAECAPSTSSSSSRVVVDARWRRRPHRRRVAAATDASRAEDDDDDASTSSARPSAGRRPGLNLLGRAVHVSDILSRRPDDVLERLATTSESYDRDVARLETIVPGLATRRARGELSSARARALARDVKRASQNVMAVKLMFAASCGDDSGVAVDAAAVCAAEDGLLDMDGATAARVKEALEAFRALLGTEGAAFCAGVPAVLLMESDARDGVIRRVRALRDALPQANIATICAKRPWIVLNDDALDVACVAVTTLRQAMPPDAKVDMMLTDFPRLLNVDIAALLEDIERTFGRDPCDILRRDPRISLQVGISPVTSSRSRCGFARKYHTARRADDPTCVS